MKISLPPTTTAALTEVLRKELGLAPGDILEATPTLANEDGLFKLQVGNKAVIARLETAVPLGVPVRVQVINTQGELVLRPLPQTEPSLQTNTLIQTEHITGRNTTLHTGHQTSPALQLNAPQRAQVINWEKPDQLTVQLGNQNLKLRIKTPLPPGTILLLRAHPLSQSLPEPNTVSAPTANTNRPNAVNPETPLQNANPLSIGIRNHVPPITTPHTPQFQRQEDHHLHFEITDIEWPEPANNEIQLRKLLPQQNSSLPPLLLANVILNKIDESTHVDTKMLAPLLEKLLSNIPSLAQLIASPDKFQHQIENSGLFLESKLTAPETADDNPTQTDLKAILLQIREAINNIPTKSTSVDTTTLFGLTRPQPPLPEFALDTPAMAAAINSTPLVLEETIALLGQTTDHALARIGLSQHALLTNQHPTTWGIDIPYHHLNNYGLMHLRVNRSSHTHDNDHQTIWNIHLSLNLLGLGPIEAQLRFYGATLDIWLHAQKNETLTLLQKNSPALRQRLSALGLKVATLACRSDPQPSTHTPPHRGWINEIT